MPQPDSDVRAAAGVGLIDLEGAVAARVLEAVPDAVLIVDGNGTVVFLNRRAEALFGYRRGELIGRAIEQLIPQGDREAHVRQREGYRRQPKPRGMGAGGAVFRALRSDGEQFPVDISLSPIEIGGQQLTISSIRDISGRLEAEATRMRLIEERARRERAEHLAEERDIFLSMAAHELNTPLTALKGGMQLALRRLAAVLGADPALEPVREAFRFAEGSATRLASVIEDVLDVAELMSTGTAGMTLEGADLGTAVAETLDSARAGWRFRERVQLDRRVEVRVQLDRRRFGHAVLHLLDTVSQFGDPEASIAIVIDRVGAEGRAGVRFRGTPPEWRPDRVQPESWMPERGGRFDAGLGFLLARRIIEVQGGRVEVELALEEETIVNVFLPSIAMP